MNKNNVIISLIALSVILGSIAVNESITVTAQLRTITDVDRDLQSALVKITALETSDKAEKLRVTTLETDTLTQDTKIQSLEDSRRDFNPVRNDYSNEEIIPVASKPVKDSEVVPLGVFCGAGEVLTGFSFEVGNNDAQNLHMRTMRVTLDGFNIEFINTGNTEVPIETLTECVIVDVIP